MSSHETSATSPLPSLVTVLIPAFNEAGMLQNNLVSVHSELCRIAHRYRSEILVVDDGSLDATWEIIGRIARERPGIRRVRHSLNLGLGPALRTGFANARGDYVVVLDADLSYDPGHVEKLLDALVSNHAHVAVVSPYMRGGRVTGVPWLRAIYSRWANWILAYFCPHADVHTLTSMVRAYRLSFVQGLNLRALGVDINTEILYKTLLLRGRIVEVPAHLDWQLQNQRGIGRVSSIRIVRSVIAYVVASFIFRPFMFFVLPGLVLALISLLVLVGTALDVASLHGSVPAHPQLDGQLSAAVAEVFRARPHSFLMIGLFAMLSLQLVSLGLIAYQSKHYFDELFHLASDIRRQTRRANVVPGNVVCCHDGPGAAATAAGPGEQSAS